MSKSILVSTNILRDQNVDIDFIPTANSNSVFERIFYNHDRGQNCFTLIGSYGTGKSTFLWAFEHHLNGEFLFNRKDEANKNFQFVKFVGESVSFKESFCEKFGLLNHVNSSNKIILKNFNFLLEEVNEKQLGLVILVDEFGKHLEYIAKNNPDEMYFIQELCEFLNDPLRDVLFITTLHQNVNAYSNALSVAQIQEWEKVRGRLMEIPFDEPVEQLLFFAAQKLSRKKLKTKKDLSNLFSLLIEHKALFIKNNKHRKQLEQLLPLDPFAAELLTKSLQKYGQNERSVFGFLESDFISGFFKSGQIITVADCFDYLVQYHFSSIEDPVRNSYKSIWQTAFSVNERLEIMYPDKYDEMTSIIKFICLSSIFSNSASILDRSFISNYFRETGKIQNADELINELEKANIIAFSRVKLRYTFKEATDLNLESELILANSHVNSDFNIISRLNEFVKLPVVFGKRAYFNNGTPRIFRSVFKEKVDLFTFDSNFDGEIVFLFEELDSSTFTQVNQIEYPVILSICLKKHWVKNELIELEKLYFVRDKFKDDKAAIRIINEEIFFRIDELRSYFEEKAFLQGYFDWYIKGEKISIKSRKDLNIQVSDLAIEYYKKAPIYLNEMVNRAVLSSPILTARKQLIKALIDLGDKFDLAFDTSKFPPEKTIYLSLIKDTGIHRKESDYYILSEPEDPSFLNLWISCKMLLTDSVNKQVTIASFYEVLMKAPFGLKKGFLDFWIPIFLIVQKEEYSLYFEDGEYIPMITPEVLDLVYKHPKKYLIRGLSTSGFNTTYLQSYKELVGFNESNVKGLQSSYISIYGNFLRFYRGLDDYSKRTKQLSKEAIGVRNAIANAKDPETALFQQIPEALGYFGLDKNDSRTGNFIEDLQNSIRTIRNCYDTLIDSLQLEIGEYLKIDGGSFENFKENILNRFLAINRNRVVNTELKLLLNRLTSPLDVRKAYWESICDAVLGKKLDKCSDDEIPMFIDRLKVMLDDLINLIDLHKLKIDENSKVYQVSIVNDDASDKMNENVFISNEEIKEVELISENIISLLKNKKDEVNKAALISALKQIIKK
jgi:hypothetical protein